MACSRFIPAHRDAELTVSPKRDKEDIIAGITYITCTPSRAIAEAAEGLRAEGIDIDLSLLYPLDLREETVSEQDLRSRLEKADAVIMDLRGGAYGLDKIFDEVFERHPKRVILSMPYASACMRYVKIGSFSGSVMAERMGSGRGEVSDPASMMKRVRRMQDAVEKAGKYIPLSYIKDIGNYVRFTRYLHGGGRQNYLNMFRMILGYLGVEVERPGDPVEPEAYGIYHPDMGYFDSLQSYASAKPLDPSRPTLGLLFFGGMHLDQSVDTVREFEQRLPGFNILPVYTDGFSTLQGMRDYFTGNGTSGVDAILSMQWFRLNGGPLGGNPRPTIELLKNLDVPVFAPAMMFMQRIENWETSDRGLDMLETIATVTWPEMDGCSEPVPVCGMRESKLNETSYSEVVSIPERVEKAARRITRRVELRRKPNSEKRIALVIYGYPPGEASVGSAAYLDTFASLDKILKRLDREGYTVELPEKPLSEIFMDFHMANSGRRLEPGKIAEKCFIVDGRDYLSIFNKLPDRAKRGVKERWGAPPGTVMTNNNGILIPALELGNILVGLQPSRPPIKNGDAAKAAHDRTVPPHHQYTAFYRWLDDTWRADAVVHVGTHGLLEFMPGKELAPSNEDFPDILVGDMPHFYLYHILNTSEATIAKRRSYATLVSYNSPPYSEAGLYEGYAELDDLIREYQSARSDPARAQRLEQMVAAKASEIEMGHMDADELHDELYRLRRNIIPCGLHVIGGKYERERARDFIRLLLRFDRGGLKGIERILTEGRGMDYESLAGNGRAESPILRDIESDADRLIGLALERGARAASASSGLPRGLRKSLLKTLEFGLAQAERFLENGAELDGLCRALEGGYVEPCVGGDVIRDPEILPSGRNIFQFDPSKVPTELAMERGADAAENTIKKYLEERGECPESAAVILWGFETTGTGGETIGQVLRYLGVRVNRKFGAWDMRLDVIPLSELGRPRIDCMVSMCGFFREMFPLQVEMLDRAFTLVSGLDEPSDMNFIRKHSTENRNFLEKDIAEGRMEPEYAERLSCARIFGPASGEYGTTMLPLIEDSAWKDDDELADAHAHSMSHVHGRNMHALPAGEIYRRNLKRVNVVSQIVYSHDYDLVDLDHYYEFFGGLSRSVENESGEKPLMLMNDSRNNVMETESAARALDRSIRARLLNPRWIDSVAEHDWHGPQKVADRVQYLIGWSATTDQVPSWTYSRVAERFVFDEHRRDQFARSNPFATHEIMERLLESYRRGYWDATEDELRNLEQAMMELDSRLEAGL